MLGGILDIIKKKRFLMYGLIFFSLLNAWEGGR